MNEYELYTRILAPRLIRNNQKELVESERDHKVTIIDKGIVYTLYRYDMNEEKERFLPFFNNTNEDKGKAVKYPTLVGLRKFCDYILLAERKDKLFVVLIEMKSGDAEGAEVQLEATACFMEYVKKTAERIKDKNGYRNFSSANIVIKKAILKPGRTRPGTNKAKSFPVDFRVDVVRMSSDTFPLYQFCR